MRQQTNPKLAKPAEPEDWSDKFPTKAACPTCDGSGKIPESNPQGSYDHKTCWKCKGTGQEEAAAAPRRFKEPICRHAGVVSQQECPYCEEEAAEPRAKPYGKRQQHATGCPYRDGYEWCNCSLNPVPPPDDVCPVSPQRLRQMAYIERFGDKPDPEMADDCEKLAAWLERGRG
jgi:hypothetical protein